MHLSFLVLAYFGPETVLPMTSIIAAVAGLIMMFGRNTLRLLWRWRRYGRDLARPGATVPAPHYARRQSARPMTEQRSEK